MSIFIGQPIYSLKDTCLKNGTLEKPIIFGVQEGVLLKRGAWKAKSESSTASIQRLSPLGMPFLTFIGQQYFYLLCLLHHPIHIPCNLLVGDLGIDLRAGNRRMPHHLSNALDRHTSL